MRRHRTTATTCARPEFASANSGLRRTSGPVLALLLAGLVALSAAPRSASGESAAVPRLVFPLVAKTLWWDNYGDPRPNGRHTGIDIMAPWRSPVVAVEAGRLKYWESSLGGCMLYLYGRSGTTYMYIHLNNDVTATNDNRGRCHEVAFFVQDGAKVAAGEQVAWSGDSGDANGNPHLHFEVHPGGGADVNPFRYLKRASLPLFAAKPGSLFSLALKGQLVSAGAGTAELQIERVRHYPGGRWLDVDARTVELAVAPDAIVAPSLSLVSAPAKRDARTALPVIAHTVKAKATIEAMLGVSGALTASRVSPAP
jgi:Peptidase family M23